MYLRVKRFFDLLFIFASFPLWLPVMIVIAVLVRLSSRGPVFFMQKRIGIGEEFFMMYKFRSMYTEAPKDVPTHLLENPNVFITPVGRFIRKYSLDELPQIINIIKGELTLVGPRPALWNQGDLIALREKYGANDIPVGLTGLAQISGRDELTLGKKAAIDGFYAKHIGIVIDIWILVRTVRYVLTGSGVREGGLNE